MNPEVAFRALEARGPGRVNTANTTEEAVSVAATAEMETAEAVVTAGAKSAAGRAAVGIPVAAEAGAERGSRPYSTPRGRSEKSSGPKEKPRLPNPEGVFRTPLPATVR
jgi:hypothetical protein